MTTINYDRKVIRAALTKLDRRADETSARIDLCLVTSDVAYTPPFDVNASFAERSRSTPEKDETYAPAQTGCSGCGRPRAKRMPVQVQMNDNAAQLQTEKRPRAARSASLSIELERTAPGFSSGVKRTGVRPVFRADTHARFRTDISLVRQASRLRL